jgi:hypothetical protein
VPDPSDPNSPDIDKHIEGIAADLGLTGRRADEADIVVSNRKHGKEISAFADASAEAMRGCPEPFRSLSCTAPGILQKDARLRRLLRGKDKLDRLSRKLGDEIGAARVDLSSDIDMVQRACDATLAHPGGDPLKERLDSAAGPLLALREGRRAQANASSATTRALKERHGSDTEEKDARIASLESENAELVLETRFLAGEQLRPVDLRTPATAGAAARAARRGPGRRNPR